MRENPGTLAIIARHLTLAVEPLKEAVSDLDNFRKLMHRLGWNVSNLPAEYADFANAVDGALQALGDMEDEPSLEDIRGLLTKAKEVHDAIQGITIAPAGVDAGEFLAEISERLFELLLTDYIQNGFPVLYNLLASLDVIQVENIPSSSSKIAHIRIKFKWQQIPKIIQDPLSIPRRVYGWGTIDLDFFLILEHLTEIFHVLGFPVSIREAPDQLALAYVESENEPFVHTKEFLKVPFYYITIGGQPLEASFVLREYRKDDAGLPGIIVEPNIPKEFPITFRLADNIALKMRAGNDFRDQFGVVIRPGDLDVKYPFKPGQQLPSTGLGIRFEFKPEESVLLLGTPDTTRVQLQSAAVSFDVNYLQGTLEVIFGVDLTGFAIIINSGEGDSFLRKIIGDNDLKLNVPLGIEWSSTRGVHFKGGGGFEVELPLHIDLGVINAESLHVQANVPVESDAGIRSLIGVNLKGKLGPLLFVVRDIGLKVNLMFTGGNAGPFDIALGFKPPTGIGLVIDSKGFKGGGLLNFEPDEQRYVGFMELEFKEKIAIKALGLLTTRLPDGSDGFSLLIIITAEFTPIQLGFGFTLNGIGGLLGLNRTANVERLRTGVKDNTLSSILFPQDIVANANRIISDLRQVFPPQANRFIFGPMAKIGWGSPTLITIDLGLMIEVPSPVRLLILGVVRAQIPNEEERKNKEEKEGREIPRILQLQVNFLGEIDFEAERLSFDASLYDSKLLSFTLSGDMALRFSWGSDPNFLLTVGGFHPAYEPPPLALPNLQRLTLSLLSGNNPRLTLETYFAVTSNTVQFGAKLELYAVKSKFNVYGFLSLDVLFQFSPFLFIADIGAMLALRIGSSHIASINVSLTLSGPTPWHARGTAKLKICWFFTFKVRFNKTFGEERDTRLDDVAVLPLLQAALSHTGNWEVQIPRGRHALVSLREIAVSGNEVVADPAGAIIISQKVVPLNVTIQKFGHQQPSDGQHFAIEQVRVGPVDETELDDIELGTAEVQEYFAPAQFFEKSDTEKLSSRSFERYDSGVKLTESEELTTDYAARRLVEYEVFYLDEQRHQGLRRRPDLLPPDFAGFNAGTRQGAIAGSPLSFANKAKSALAPSAVRFSQEQFVVVSAIDLSVIEEAVAASEAGAYSLLNEMIRNNPDREGELQVVPIFEVNRS